LKYPPSIETLIGIARSNDITRAKRDAANVLALVIDELDQYSASALI
jgi:hypothetical protein